MSDDRRGGGELAEHIDALVEAIVGGGEVDTALRLLAQHCQTMLNVPAVGLLLAVDPDNLVVSGAPDPDARFAELFDQQDRPGPPLVCYRIGRPVSFKGIPGQAKRWPEFGAALAEVGMASAQALPLRAQGETVGALTLFRAQPIAVTPPGTRVTQTLAISIAGNIVLLRSLRASQTLSGQLRAALASRIPVEQAKGFLSARHHITVDQAFTVLRGFARSHSRPIRDVARAVLAGQLDIVDHRPLDLPPVIPTSIIPASARDAS